MDKEIVGAVAAIMGTVVGAGISAFFQRRASRDADKKQQRAAIDAAISQMLGYTIQYPSLESLKFCKDYPSCTDDTEKERYEAYCCFVFNTLVKIWAYCDGNSEKVSGVFHVAEIARLHHRWWEHDQENFGYSREFRQFINGVIDDLKKEGKLK